MPTGMAAALAASTRHEPPSSRRGDLSRGDLSRRDVSHPHGVHPHTIHARLLNALLLSCRSGVVAAAQVGEATGAAVVEASAAAAKVGVSALEPLTNRMVAEDACGLRDMRSRSLQHSPPVQLPAPFQPAASFSTPPSASVPPEPYVPAPVHCGAHAVRGDAAFNTPPPPCGAAPASDAPDDGMETALEAGLRVALAGALRGVEARVLTAQRAAVVLALEEGQRKAQALWGQLWPSVVQAATDAAAAAAAQELCRAEEQLVGSAALREVAMQLSAREARLQTQAAS